MTSVKQSANVQQCNKEFICVYDNCEKSYSSLTHLNRHEDIHKDKTYQCKECNAVFKSQYAQKRHIDNKHLKKKPKKYKCEHCGEDFNKKSWLNRHIFKHTGIKPYMCTFKDCDARFLVPQKLRRHLKMHEGYTCPNESCNEKFAKWSEVRKHVAVAHPKILKCPECEQEFSRSNNLRSHLVIHKLDRQVFLCPHEGCHRFYSRKNTLQHHITSYHDKRPYKCTFGLCKRIFSSQEALDNHVSIHSPSRRLKKKKKKKKPSFAEELAGLAPRKWQIDILKDSSKSTKVISSSDSTPMEEDPKESQEKELDVKEILISSNVDENCNKVPLSVCDELLNNVNEKDDDLFDIQNDDIQTLLSIIEKRSYTEAEKTAQNRKCISIEV